jgi:hemolysin activation/secretion protein
VIGNLEADAQVDAYQGFVNELRLQRLQRDQGMTIGQIALVAEEVTKYYRDRGYILARAIVPAQEVVDGIVTIHVLEGRLAQVTPQNNVRYDSEAVTAPFDAALGKLVTVERMEQGLLTLGKYPGMLATGVFRPGPGVGTTEMILNVQREDPFGWSARTDNHGSTFTGRYRLLFDFSWNSPSGDGDLLYGSVLKSLQPDAALYGSVRYEAPFPDPSYRWGVDVSQNAFDAFDPEDGSPLASGASYNGKAYLEHYTRLSRTAKSWFTLDLTRKRSESLDFDTDIVNTRDDLAVLGLQFNRENIDGKAQVITSGFFRADKGLASLFGVPSEEEAQDPSRSPGYSRANGPAVRFIKYSFGYSMLKVLGPTQTLVLRGSGNYSTDYLVAVEQFNMGGPSNVRGANVSAALRDSGIFGSVEWNIRAPGFADKPAWWGDQPWGRTLGVTLFYDHAIGWQNRTPSEDQVKTFTYTKIEMNGLGFGVDLALPWGIAFKTQVAKLVSGRDGGADPAAIEDTTQVWFEFSRSF